MLRALAETRIDGIATTIPAHVAILEHPDFIAGEHSTKWVEEKLDLSSIAAPTGGAASPGAGGEAAVLREVDAEVDGRKYTVKLWVPDVAPVAVVAAGAGGGATPAAPGRPAPPAAASGPAAIGAGSVTVPMQGTIVKVLVAEGDTVEVGQALCVLEAMKMENNIVADVAGTVKTIKAQPGQTLGAGDVVMIIEPG